MKFNEAILAVAATEIGVREEWRNGGTRVDEYLASVGLGTGYPWCAAFVFFCSGKARPPGHINPCPRTAGAIKLWELSNPHCRREVPGVGHVFVLDKGHGLGHVGIVEEVDGDEIVSIEGNSSANGSREGDTVVRHKWNWRDGHRGRLLGFVDLGCKIGDEATS